jgi:uncharacterized membrane protein YhhN
MSRLLNILFLIFSTLYIALDNVQNVPVYFVLKIIPIAILFFVVYKTPKFFGKTILLFALFFSACGDLLLSFDLFIFGIAAFLIAQLHYATHFVRHWRGLKTRWLLSLLMVGYMLFMAWLLMPHLGELRLPVLAYLIVISLMGLMAIQSSLSLQWSVLGALVFIVSDSLIAVNKFIHPIPMSGEAIMLTYYAAQWLIITGCLASRRASGQR